mgnify:CR=1 FL=1
MKRIIELCSKEARDRHSQDKSDTVKLRLRGKGSGYKESNGEES